MRKSPTPRILTALAIAVGVVDVSGGASVQTSVLCAGWEITDDTPQAAVDVLVDAGWVADPYDGRDALYPTFCL